MPNVFISYVRQNSDQVDKLAEELRRHGVTVWKDRDEIRPGEDWHDAIRQAIKAGDYFIACFSAEYEARRRTYMNTEIGLAIDMIQEMPPGRIWFIPVLLSECEIPDRTIGGGQTLRDRHWEPLHKDWNRGVRRLLEAMGIERKGYEPELIRIPAGEFLMGDDKSPVAMAEFYVGKYPITNAQYEAFVQANVYELPKHWRDRGRIPVGKENHPIVFVSWRDAVSFCEWLSEETGRKFRLPTEGEWEKAARSTDGREFPWGNEPPTKDNERCNFRSSGIGDTSPVGTYPKGASLYGVLDMVGNVWEWTSSLYSNSNLFDLLFPDAGPEDESTLQSHVVRGGSFANEDRYVRCTSWSYHHPTDPDDFLGFRVVCVSPPS